MDAMTVQQLRRECAARVLARRRAPVERVRHGANFEHGDLVSLTVEGSTYLPPLTVTEWLDDMCAVALQWRGPWTVNLAEIAEAARVSERAAVAAIAGARKLAPWDAWHLYTELERWRQEAHKFPFAMALMRSLVGAWEKTRGLVDERPAYSELPELPDRPQPRELTYETPFGFPAGRLAWA